MPIEFRIDERLAGTAATSARKGERVAVFPRSLLGPQDVGLPCALDALQGCLFSKIPGLPLPPRIGDLIVVIDQDLSCKAFVDELSLRATIKVVRPIEKDEAVFLRDISAIEAVHLDVTVPEDAAVVVVRSFNWSRSLFFDFGPLHEEFGKRTYNLESALGQQMTLLYGLPTPGFKLSAG